MRVGDLVSFAANVVARNPHMTAHVEADGNLAPGLRWTYRRVHPDTGEIQDSSGFVAMRVHEMGDDYHARFWDDVLAPDNA